MSSRFSKNFINLYCRSWYKHYGGTAVKRKFCSSSQGSDKSILNIPLSKPVEWIPAPIYAVTEEDKSETRVTTLENGLRVASENKFGSFCTVGVVIDSGSRYEAPYPSGITHFLEKLAFGKTDLYENKDMILQKLEKVGGICDAQGSRDTLIYAMSVSTEGLESVTEILSEVILRPHITDQEIEDTQMAAGFELEMLETNPEPDALLTEIIHKAAYGNQTLGLPKFTPPQNIPLINRGHIYTYMKNLHAPERMVLTGAGVQHEELVEFAKKYFVSKTPIWEENAALVDESVGREFTLARYTGGSELLSKDLSNVNPGPSPIPDLAHIVIGLESCSPTDPDFITFCVLNMLLGGGGSFSAGGPGKGMYTRLYTNVLNRYHWMYNATAYNHSYADTGVFCIHASSPPHKVKELVEVIALELAKIPHGIYEEELSRAKKQLQSMLLINLESRSVMFEDIGRQVLTLNKRLSAQYYYEEIEKITEGDVIRVAKRMLSSRPSLAAMGNLAKLPSLRKIEGMLKDVDSNKKKFSLFNF